MIARTRLSVKFMRTLRVLFRSCNDKTGLGSDPPSCRVRPGHKATADRNWMASHFSWRGSRLHGAVSTAPYIFVLWCLLKYRGDFWSPSDHCRKAQYAKNMAMVTLEQRSSYIDWWWSYYALVFCCLFDDAFSISDYRPVASNCTMMFEWWIGKDLEEGSSHGLVGVLSWHLHGVTGKTTTKNSDGRCHGRDSNPSHFEYQFEVVPRVNWY